MFWAYVGTFYLILMCYTDIKEQEIDDRRNYIMLGLTLYLYQLFNHPLWYLFVVVGVIIFSTYLLSKYKGLEEGDISALKWLFLGYTLMDVGILFYFSVVLIVFSVLQFVFIKLFEHFRNIRGSAAYYPVILLSFVFVNVIFDLY